MRKIYKLIFTGLFLMAASPFLFGQNQFFTDAGANRITQNVGQRVIIPESYRLAALDFQAMRGFLFGLPSEANLANRSQAPVLSLPKPDGSVAHFRVWESSIQEPALQARFSEIRTYLGQGIEDRYATIRFDIGPNGFHAQVLSANGSYYIDPYSRGDIHNYISYFRTDLRRSGTFLCEVPDNPSGLNRTEAVCLGTNLRTYRLAVACTGEYAQAPGISAGSNPAILHNAIVTSVNRVVGVYEREVAVRMVLVANNNIIEYLNAGTDPFNGNNNAGVLIGESQVVIDANIGTANYDIGHTFSTGGGGLASLNSPCNASSKARGITGSGNPTGDAYDIDYVAHEMGHQFGGNHSFNGSVGNCSGGNRNGSTAYEPGSGTTIQAYAGICGSDDIQPNSDPHFHAISFDEISNFIVSGGGAACNTSTATGNGVPVIDPLTNNNLTIPVSTPFTLTGTATDPDSDPLTYCWEQWDLGAQGQWNTGGTTTNAPLFKSRVPKTTGSRTFPDMAVILAGYPANPAGTMGGLKGETLPSVARAMKFKLTVRDNRAGGGGVASSGAGGCQTATIFTVNTAGSAPFTVALPNGGESYPAASIQTITWNVVGTDVAPFNVANVKISLSTDGGLTYPTVISASTANDGSEALTIPSVNTTTARVKIEALGNIFFDISNSNFTITPPVNGFTFNSPAAVTAVCPAPNVMTSGNLTATYVGTYTGSITLSGTVIPAGPTVSFSNGTLTQASPSSTVSLTGMASLSPGSYTVTVTGTGDNSIIPNPVVNQNITFTINPGTGPTITGQPVNTAACAGTNASFTSAATGSTGVQWQVSTVAVPTFTNIGGATTTTLTLTAVTAGMSGNQYRCVFTGQCGTSTSNAVTLTVNVAPTVTANPANQSVCSGNGASFTAAGNGTPAPTYQWQVSTAAVPAFTNVGGATSATYTIASTTVAMNGDQYRCVITNVCGSVNTTAATLSVSSSVTITTNPTAQTICEGTNTSFTVAAGGTGLTYQWQVSTDGGTNYTNLAATAVYGGVATPTLTLTNTPPTLNTYRYRCVVSSGICTPGISTGALLTVNTFPNIGTQPAAVTICEGANASFSVAATTGVGLLSYQWQLSTNGGASFANIAGATTNTFAQTNIPATQNGYQFRVAVTAGCGTTNSSAVALTVNTYPIVVFGSIPVNICKSDPSFSLSATPAGGAWSGTGVSGSTFTPIVAGVGARTVTYTVTNAGCTTAQPRVINVLECPERHRRLPDFQAAFVYPNPSNGVFSIRLNSDLYTRIGARVFGSDGKLYKSQVFTGVGYGSIMPVDISRLPGGVYQLFLYNDESGFDKKAVSIIIYK